MLERIQITGHIHKLFFTFINIARKGMALAEVFFLRVPFSFLFFSWSSVQRSLWDLKSPVNFNSLTELI